MEVSLKTGYDLIENGRRSLNGGTFITVKRGHPVRDQPLVTERGRLQITMQGCFYPGISRSGWGNEDKQSKGPLNRPYYDTNTALFSSYTLSMHIYVCLDPLSKASRLCLRVYVQQPGH